MTGASPAVALAAAGELAEPDAPPEEVRRLAEEVLSDPVFDRPAPSFLAEARAWVVERVADVVERVLAAAGGGPLAWVVVAVVAALLVALVVGVTRGLAGTPGSAGHEVDAPLRPPHDWLADAGRWEEAGEWRAALRCRYRALVASLAARGLVTEVPGRTAGEYRRAVARAAPGVADDFAGATALFEQAWYGAAPVGADESARLRSLSDEVLAGVGGRR